MIIAPLAAIAASHIPSLAEDALRPIVSRGMRAFDRVLDNQSALQAKLQQAKKLIGLEVVVENSNNLTVAGKVEDVVAENDKILLQIDGKKYDIAKLQEILSRGTKGIKV